MGNRARQIDMSRELGRFSWPCAMPVSSRPGGVPGSISDDLVIRAPRSSYMHMTMSFSK